MRCRRICRELLWLARFGEFGPSSAPHLDHLAHCGNCREEVGYDRALVQQLRIALAERIEQSAPSPGAWGVILERAQTPERGIGAFVHGRAGALAARLRTATAISAMALAGVIATSTNVAITHPEAGSAETQVVTSGAGEQFERQPLLPRPNPAGLRVPVTYVVAVAPSDPETAFLVNATLGGSELESATVEESGMEVTETVIETTLSIGTYASRSAPVDSANDDASSIGDAVATPADPAASGEPF